MRFEILRERRTIAFIIGVVVIVGTAVGVILILPSFSPENIEKGEIKEKVSQKIGRQNFTVDQILVESDGWTLGKIASTASDDKGNPALVILHQENNQLVLKFGPGTLFKRSDLENAAVPEAILDALYGGESKYIPDPILSYMPHDTNFYSVKYTPSGGEEGVDTSKKLLTVTIYEVPRLGIYATPEKKAEYKAEIEQWIRSIGLDPNNYTLYFTT